MNTLNNEVKAAYLSAFDTTTLDEVRCGDMYVGTCDDLEEFEPNHSIEGLSRSTKGNEKDGHISFHDNDDIQVSSFSVQDGHVFDLSL